MSQKRSMPEDFKTFAPGKSLRSLIARYHCHQSVAARWLSEANIEPTQYKPKTSLSLPTMARNVVQRDMTLAGQAADYYRAWGALVRCNAAGRFDAAGKFWKRGSTLLTAEEVIDRAKRKGFDPDSWKKVAA